MSNVSEQAEGQTKHWNGPAGNAWIEAQEVLDRLFHPFEDMLVEALAEAPEGPVLDVGCGTGATTLAAAATLPKRRCVGVDISAPMLEVARSRAGAAAEFICADAQRHAFEPAAFATIISRFGVMFFDDAVAAFANLRRAARAGARLRCVAWRSPAENPFMTTAERAAAPLLPELPVRQPDEPGQFGFADRERVLRILEESGWAETTVEPVDVPCVLPESMLEFYITRLGPVGLALQKADERKRAEIVETIRGAFDRFVQGDEIRFSAACWLVDARAMR